MRKVRPKPRRKKITPSSPLQRQAQRLLALLEDDRTDLAFESFIEFADEQNGVYLTDVPNDFCLQMLTLIDSSIRCYGDNDNKFYVTMTHTIGKYPTGGKQIRKEGSSKTFWVAVAICYLKLCLALNKKL